MAALPTVFDYDFSPYSQKIRLLLAAQGTSFQRNDVSAVLPRPTLEKLGITYRRIPIAAIGKDVYVDSALIIDVLQKNFLKVHTGPFDAAFEAFGNSVFTSALAVVPSQALTPEFIKDRETIFPLLKRPDFASLRPSGLAEWNLILNTVENEFLAAQSGTFINGEEISLADIHVAWVIRWVLTALGLGQEHGFAKNNFPRVYKWIESLPQPRMTVIDNDTVVASVLGSGFSAESIGIDEKDPTGLKAGEEVSIENSDTTPGAHPQKGKLHGLSPSEIVLDLPTAVRLHFPRRGYILRKA